MTRIVVAAENSNDNPAARHKSGAAFVLRGILDQAGIAQTDYTFVPLLKNETARDVLIREKKQGIPGFLPPEPGKYFPATHAAQLSTFLSRIEQIKPNVVLALGNMPMWALTKHVGIMKWRGTPLLSASGIKVIPTWSTTAVIRQWELRPIVYMDAVKAKRHSETPLFHRPQRYIYMPESIADIASFFEQYIAPAPHVGVDVETKGNTITEVGFAPTWKRALVIPFWSRATGSFWPTAALEREAWEWVRRILAEKKVIGQNFQYDMQYFIRTMGIGVPQFAGDTMLLHHSLQPEMKKGLGFLASIYTDQPQWKDMRAANDTLKTEDD